MPDDQMVEHLDVQKAVRLNALARHGDVVGGRRRVARRMETAMLPVAKLIDGLDIVTSVFTRLSCHGGMTGRCESRRRRPAQRGRCPGWPDRPRGCGVPKLHPYLANLTPTLRVIGSGVLAGWKCVMGDGTSAAGPQEGRLTPSGRSLRAELARKAHFTRLAHLSAKARRDRPDADANRSHALANSFRTELRQRYRRRGSIQKPTQSILLKNA